MPKPKVEMLKSSALFEETNMLPSQAVGFPKDWGVPGAEFEALIDCWFKSQLFFFEGIRFAGCICLLDVEGPGLLVTHCCYCEKYC